MKSKFSGTVVFCLFEAVLEDWMQKDAGNERQKQDELCAKMLFFHHQGLYFSFFKVFVAATTNA